MDKLPDFKLSNTFPISKPCIEKQLRTFEDVCYYVQQLPYGRNSNRSDFSLVMNEGRGTCSTKHAFLSQIAIENSIQNVDLYIGIYQMNSQNTKGIRSVLNQFEIAFLPEAHTYLKIDGKTFDFTSVNSEGLKFKDSLMSEEKILPYQIRAHKIKRHQDFLKNWIEKNNIAYSFEEIWNIREACIAKLSQ